MTRPSESPFYAGVELSYLEILMVDLGACANCCIAEASDQPHVDCAGPEGYECVCVCDGAEVEVLPRRRRGL